MDCIKNNKQGAEILTDYCAGTADPRVAAEIDAHTKVCAECRAMVEAQCAVWEMLDAWTPAEVSRDFDARLYARIASEQNGPVWRRWWSRLFQPATPHAWWKPMVSLGAAAAIVSMALIVRLPEQIAPVQQKSTIVQSAAQASSQPAGSPEEIDLQQVQQALDDLDIVAPVSQAPISQTAASPL
jgi:hypothetical protein